MNREIKFRGWNGRRWTREYTLNEMLCEYLENNGLKEKWVQYTGLKDKNGKEIYEGDICYPVRNTEPYVVAFGTHETCEGDYYSSTAHGFYLKAVYPEPYIAERSLPYYSGIEIIGNIYENPELSTNKD